MKRLVIGILAHVDSGKTTLSEGMLYQSGEIRKLGRVDHKNTFLDTHSLERKRGITIFSKQATIKLENTEFTLLDTPGHIDFSAETERTLQVLDYAVLVINGAEGIQSHTETLWKLLKIYNIPVFLFVNKMDFDTADKLSVMNEIKKRLSDNCIDFHSDDIEENLALCDESLMNEYMDTLEISEQNITENIQKRNVFPCVFGSALKMQSIDKILDIIDKYTSEPAFNNEFSAKVFKISEDEQGNRLTHLKITGGELKVKTILNGIASDGTEWAEKINNIRIYSGSKFKAVEKAESGMICAVTGLTKTYSGLGLGEEADSKVPLLEPVLSYKVEIPDNTDAHTVLAKLRKIEEEEPELHIVWNEQLQEIHIQLMGEIQLEILKSIIYERFGMNIEFSHGKIAYKETISGKSEGVGHYEPLKHYAEVHLLIEAGKRGSGLQFASDCREDTLERNWQRLILTHLKEKKHIGVLTGSPITDMKITLVSGKAHLKHTEGGDFRQATYRAVRHGLKHAQSVLLEPYYEFKLEVPSESIGRAMNDLQMMDAVFSSPEVFDDMTVISGKVPAEAIRDYQSELTGYTKGKGRISCILCGYEPCRNPEKVIAEIGYDSENDIDNTADSVFCSHGAGFVVKWDKVHEYMHLESILKPQKEEVSQPTKVSSKTMAHRDIIAEDKELMEIFERTYGTIKRDERSALYTEKNIDDKDEKKYKSKDIKTGAEYLLVDGYNIIFAWDNLKKLAEDNLDLARNTLINIMGNYQGFKKCHLIIVFDAYKVKGNTGEVEKIHNIDVVYTKEAETADTYIERVTHELGKNHRVRVATSDSLEQLIILGNGAYRVSASEFYNEVKMTEREISEYIDNVKHNIKRKK